MIRRFGALSSVTALCSTSKKVVTRKHAKNKSTIPTVYLLDPEQNEFTEIFAEKFKHFVDWKIKCKKVTTCSECKRHYPIALLSIRHTDRPSEDIESILEHLDKEYYKRTVLIYIHVRYNKSFLPRIPTKVKTSDFGDCLYDIFDFGLVNNKIKSCSYAEKLDSKDAFKKFVLKL